jgi:hypothetical protein
VFKHRRTGRPDHGFRPRWFTATRGGFRQGNPSSGGCCCRLDERGDQGSVQGPAMNRGSTIRLRLLKIPVRIKETASRVRLAFATNCPDAALFRGLIGTLSALSKPCQPIPHA